MFVLLVIFYKVIDDLIDLGLQPIFNKSHGANITEITNKTVEILALLVLDYSGYLMKFFFLLK